VKVIEVEIPRILLALNQTLKRIEKAALRVDKKRLHARSSQEPWSANDILGHIRACADVWGGSMEEMLEQDHPRLGYIHPRQWIKRTDYPELDFHTSFKAYKSQRKKLLQTLKKLSLKEWARGAIIQGREHTIFTQARRMAMHEGVHCEQIESLLQ
jgi:hypothetical protein